MLEEMAVKKEGAAEPMVESFREYHQYNRVHFIVDVPSIGKQRHEDIIKNFKLQTSIPCTNYVLFDAQGKIAKYQTEIDILKEFFNLRK